MTDRMHMHMLALTLLLLTVATPVSPCRLLALPHACLCMRVFHAGFQSCGPTYACSAGYLMAFLAGRQPVICLLPCACVQQLQLPG